MNRMHPRQIIPILVLLSGTASGFADEPEAGAPPVEQPKQTPSAQTPPNEAAIAAASVQTTAADSTPPAKPSSDVVEVRVFGRHDDALQKVPGSGTLVGAKEIRRAQPNDAGEVLRRVPGLHVHPEAGQGMRLNLGMRGLDPTRRCQLLVLEDGMRVALKPSGGPGPASGGALACSARTSRLRPP